MRLPRLSGKTLDVGNHVNPRLSRSTRAVLVLAALLLPVMCDYFVFFTLAHHPHFRSFAYPIVALGILGGAGLLAWVLTGPSRLIGPMLFIILTFVGTWLSALCRVLFIRQLSISAVNSAAAADVNRAAGTPSAVDSSRAVAAAERQTVGRRNDERLRRQGRKQRANDLRRFRGR